MRVSWWRTHELVLARVLLVACVAMAPVGIAWLWLVDARDGVPMALVACGVPLLALLPYLGPTIHALDVVPDGLVLHDVLGRARRVRRDEIDRVLLVPSLLTLGRHGETSVTSRIVVVGRDGAAIARGSWQSAEPAIDALEGAGVPVEADFDPTRPRDLEARIPGSTAAIERVGMAGIWGIAIAAIAVMVGVIALVLQAIPA